MANNQDNKESTTTTTVATTKEEMDVSSAGDVDETESTVVISEKKSFPYKVCSRCQGRPILSLSLSLSHHTFLSIPVLFPSVL
jgi:hypothetical protein